MKFDRNTVIGFGVMAVLLIGYIVLNNNERKAFERDKAIKDSIAQANYRIKDGCFGDVDCPAPSCVEGQVLEL